VFKAKGSWGRVYENELLERNNKLKITRNKPNWPEEEDYLAFCKHSRGVELWTTEKTTPANGQSGI